MKFDKLKPDLQNLNLAGVKKAASRAARVRVKLSRRQWIAIACAVIAVGLLLAMLLRPRPASVTLPVVAVEPVTTEDVNIYGDYVGRIRAQQFVEIRARVEGYLEKMLFAEGTYIKIRPRRSSTRRARRPSRPSATSTVSVRSTSRARPASSNWTTPSLRTRAPRPTWWWARPTSRRPK